MSPHELARLIRVRAATAKGRRFITAIAGAPGAGKSTLAEAVVAELGLGARLVPMDGFHYDNFVLEPRGLLPRKGAPETFDAAGFVAMVARLRQGEEVAIPVFDRSVEFSRAAADLVSEEDRLIVVEGNYLLLEEAPWSRLAPFFDMTVFLNVPEAELERRLIRRWLDHGYDTEAARAKALSNDIPNARRVARSSRSADVVIDGRDGGTVKLLGR
jgi:pantothenate kinase